MAKPKTYKTNSGGHVRLYLGEGGRHTTIVDIPAGGEYTTEDKQEQEALDASSEVSAGETDERPEPAPEPEREEAAERPAERKKGK